jgi:hypothetical protein
MKLPLVLAPYEAKLIVIGPMPSNASTPEPLLSSRTPLQQLDGNWDLNIEGKDITTPLKSWQDLGVTNITKPGIYKKAFTLAAIPAGKHVFLECAELRDYARVRLNGVALEAHAWQPYRWDLTGAAKPGDNQLEIEVRSAPEGRRPAPIPTNPGAANRPPAGAPRDAPPPQVSGLIGPVRLVTANQ